MALLHLGSNEANLIYEKLNTIEGLLKDLNSKNEIQKDLPDRVRIKEAAEILCMSTSRLYSDLRNYPHYKDRGRVYFSTKELLEYIDSKRYKTVEERFNDKLKN